MAGDGAGMDPAIKDVLDRITCGDCLELMRKLPDESVDLVVTSPPYNLRNTTGGGLFSGGKTWKNPPLSKGYDNYDDNMPYDEYCAWQRECLKEMLRLVKEDGAIFYNHKWRVQGGLIQDRREIVSEFPVRQVIIWKRAGGVNFNDCFFLPTYEVIYLIAKPKYRLVPTANRRGDIWEFPQRKESQHPAPFPLALPKICVSSSKCCMERDAIVLDPFMGSGTTAVAAWSLGKHYIGFDISEDYCGMARDRVKEAASGAPLFLY